MKKRSWILIIIILFCIGLSILLLNIVKRINIDKLIIKEVIKPYGETITINDFLKEDIKNVNGIGESKFNMLKNYICI